MNIGLAVAAGIVTVVAIVRVVRRMKTNAANRIWARSAPSGLLSTEQAPLNNVPYSLDEVFHDDADRARRIEPVHAVRGCFSYPGGTPGIQSLD